MTSNAILFPDDDDNNNTSANNNGEDGVEEDTLKTPGDPMETIDNEDIYEDLEEEGVGAEQDPPVAAASSVDEGQVTNTAPKKAAKKRSSPGAKKGGPAEKKKDSVYFSDQEKHDHEQYLKQHPDPKAEKLAALGKISAEKILEAKNDDSKKEAASKAKAKYLASVVELLETYKKAPLNGDPIPPTWTLRREAAETTEAVEQRKFINANMAAEKWFGRKKEKAVKNVSKGETNEEFNAKNKGLRYTHFSEYTDEDGKSRWVLSVRHFPSLGTESHRQRIDSDPDVELYIEKPPAWLMQIEEFAARLYNWTYDQLIPNFRGLVPMNLILDKIRRSLIKTKEDKEGNAAGAAAGEEENTNIKEVASKANTCGDLIELYDRKVATRFLDGITHIKEQNNAMLSELNSYCGAYTPASERVDNAFEKIRKTIYDEGKESTESRRAFFEKKLKQMQELPKDKRSTILDLALDFFDVEGKWKEEMNKKNVVKYMADLLQSTDGKVICLILYAVAEASRTEAASRCEKLREAIKVKSKSDVDSIEALVERFNSFEAQAKDAEASANQKITVAHKALVEAESQLKEDREQYAAKLEEAKKVEEHLRAELLEITRELQNSAQKTPAVPIKQKRPSASLAPKSTTTVTVAVDKKRPRSEEEEGVMADTNGHTSSPAKKKKPSAAPPPAPVKVETPVTVKKQGQSSSPAPKKTAPPPSPIVDDDDEPFS